MKTSKEMADSVFQIRDACNEKRKKRRLIAQRAVCAAAAVCMFGGVFLGVRHSAVSRKRPPEVSVIDTAESTAASENITQTSAEQSAVTSTKTTSEKKERTTESNTYTTLADTTVTEAETEPEAEEETDSEETAVTEKADDTPDIRTAPATSAERTEPTVTVTMQVKPDVPSSPATVSPSSSEPGAVIPSGEQRIPTTEYDIPWSELDIEKRYTEAMLRDEKYRSAEKEVDADMIDELIGKAEMSGFEGETKHTCTAEAFRIKGYPEREAVAIRFSDSDKYYFYIIDTEKE